MCRKRFLGKIPQILNCIEIIKKEFEGSRFNFKDTTQESAFHTAR